MRVGDSICLIVPCASLRTDPADSSETCTEALGGEFASIQAIGQRDWIQVQLKADGYRGWTDRKQWKLDEPLKEEPKGVVKPFLLQAPASPWLRADGAALHLPAGAVVSLNADDTTWSFAGVDVRPLFPLDDIFQVHPNPLQAVQAFAGAPYRWGGRCAWGIDCSGLIQVAFMLCGHQLPRDASEQASIGESVEWSERKTGDLVFFQNDKGHIVHVGMLQTPDLIIHAAGEVRLDELREEGIWRNEKYTHVMSHLRRMAI